MIMTKFNKEIKNKSPNAKTRRGSILVYVLVLMTVISIILVSILQYISTQLKFSFNRVEKEKAFQVAEAGIYFYRWYLAHSVDGKTAQQVKAFWQNENPYGVNIPGNPNYPFKADFFDPEGGKIGEYEIEVEAPDPASTIVVVKSTGYTMREPNLKRVVQARFRRPSWSEYAALANDFMRFGAGTTVSGKIHSNKGIRFDGLAKNVVSSLVCTFNDPDHSGSNESAVHTHIAPIDPIPSMTPPCQEPPERTDIFQAGRQLEVPEVSFNILSDLDLMKSEAQAGNGRYFNNQKLNDYQTDSGRRIKLKADGTFDVCAVNDVGGYNTTTYAINSYLKTSGSGSCSSCSGQCLSNYAIADNGIIFIEGNAWVDGTINNKKVSIVAANLIAGPADRDIYIGMAGAGDIGDIKYTNYDGKDIVGLVAQRNISVVSNSKNNLTIEAALLAQSGRVGRSNYSGNYKSSITINGSIATNLRYGFAYDGSSYNCGGGVTIGSGYCTRNLNFDNNLLHYPPPYFPTGTEYSIDLWDEL